MSYLKPGDDERLKQALAGSGLSAGEFIRKFLPTMAHNRLFPGWLYVGCQKDLPACCIACGDPVNEDGHCESELEMLEGEIEEVLGV